MKWIGQHIYDLVARFRSDVYLEDISTGTIASGGNLGLDANNKIVKATEASGDITSVSIRTDTGSGDIATDTGGSADFSILGANGVGVTNSGTTITAAAVPEEIDHDSLLNFASNEHFTQANITTVGTIDTGVWNGTAIASSHLDADTAHLTTNQTFTGVKTFSELTIMDGDRNLGASEAGFLHMDASTLTNNTTSASGTLARFAAVNLEFQTLAATNASVTTTDAASLYIMNAPVAGTNMTITNRWSLWIDAGNARFDGSIYSGTTEAINSSGVVQVAAQTVIDHDQLANFVANEHLRWDNDVSGTATIHASNIPTLNQNTTGSAATLTTARAFQTDLASTSTANFDGSAANTHGVTGTLAVGNGGTGNTSGNATGLTASTSNSIGVGSIELGHADDTTLSRSASGTLAVEGKNVRTEDKHLFIKQGSFAVDAGTSIVFFPMTGTAENTSAAGISIPMLAPADGKLLKIHFRSNKDHSAGNQTFTLKNWDNNETFTAGNASNVGAKTVTGVATNNVIVVDFQSSLDSGTNAFTVGETIGIGMTNAVDIGSSTKYWFTAVFEFDFSSY